MKATPLPLVAQCEEAATLRQHQNSGRVLRSGAVMKREGRTAGATAPAQKPGAPQAGSGPDSPYLIEPGKIERDLGWGPEVAFAEGLAEAVDWYVVLFVLLWASFLGGFLRFLPGAGLRSPRLAGLLPPGSRDRAGGRRQKRAGSRNPACVIT